MIYNDVFLFVPCDRYEELGAVCVQLVNPDQYIYMDLFYGL